MSDTPDRLFLSPEDAAAFAGKYGHPKLGLVCIGEPSVEYVLKATHTAEIARLTARAEAAEAERDKALEDRMRFPDRPDTIGQMIEAHIGNLKAAKESANEHAHRAFDRAFAARARALEEAADMCRIYADGLIDDNGSYWMRHGLPIAIRDLIPDQPDDAKAWEQAAPVGKEFGAQPDPRDAIAPETAFVEAEAEFGEYFRKNYPGPDTIINKPDWHSPRIFRAAVHCLRNTFASRDEALDRAREALVQAELYIARDEENHGRAFGDGNAVRAALSEIDKLRGK